jgi:hypothetical protein
MGEHVLRARRHGVVERIDASVVSAMMAHLSAGDALAAVQVLAAAAGVPSWAVGALVALMQGDMAGARTQVESGIGSSSSALIGRLLEHQLNVSGIPPAMLEAVSPEVVLAVATGNVSRAVRALAAAYELPVWSADALVALTSAPQPGSSASGAGGLASLLSSGAASTRLGELLSGFNVSGQLQALGLGSEYEEALVSGSMASLLAVLASVTPASAGRRLSIGGVNVTALSRLFGQLALVTSTASGLQRAWRTGDVGLALRSVVAAAGEQDSPLGESLLVIATAASVAERASTVSTLADASALVSSALVVLPVDSRAAGLLGDLVRVGGLASQLLRAASESPPDLDAALETVVSLAAVLGAPDWLLSGLHKIGGVAAAAPRLVSALAVPDVPLALEALVEMASVVAGTDAWMVSALRLLMGGNVTGAIAVMQPQLGSLTQLLAPLVASSDNSPLCADGADARTHCLAAWCTWP